MELVGIIDETEYLRVGQLAFMFHKNAVDGIAVIRGIYDSNFSSVSLSSLCSVEVSLKIRAVWQCFDCYNEGQKSLRIWHQLQHLEMPQDVSAFYPYSKLSVEDVKQIIDHTYNLLKYTTL